MTALKSPAVIQKPRIFYGYIIVACAFFIMITIWSAFNAYGVFFKPMMTEFGWNRAMTSSGFSLALLVSGLLGIPAGQITDRLGTRLIMTVCGTLLGAGYMLMSLVQSSWQFYLFYGGIIGIGMSGCFAPLSSTVARWFITRRGLMTGVVLVGSGLGSLLGPQIASWLITRFEWRTAYLILGAVVITVITLFSQFLRRDPADIGQTPYVRDQKNYEVKKTSPGLPMADILKTSRFWIFFMALTVYGYYTPLYMVHIVPYADDLGFSARTAATVISLFGVGMVTGRILWGIAADRFGNKLICTICYIISAIAILALIYFHQLWLLYLLMFLGGCSQGGVMVTWSTLTSELFGVRSLAFILSVQGLGYSIMASAGPVLTGYLFDTTNSYQSAFLIGGVLAFIGSILIAILKPASSKNKPTNKRT